MVSSATMIVARVAFGRVPDIVGPIRAGTGALVLGLSLWLQLQLMESSAAFLQGWALHTTLSQALVTGLLAPLVGSWQLLIWRRRVPA